MVKVIKYDGSEQEFDRKKVMRTCRRMGASKKVAKEITDIIENKAYDGMRTKKIMDMVFKQMKKHKPSIRYTINLRDAISMLRPKPDFEIFVARILKAQGYKVKSNQIIKGKCVDYETDAVAEKDDEVLFVEVKHHYKAHTYTGVSVFLETRAKLEDLIEGHGNKNNKSKFTKALIVCNTKFSDHGKKYAKCRGISYIGWKAPEEYGLERMIEEKKLYPITFLKDMTSKDQVKLGDNRIVTLKQLANGDIDEIVKKTKVSKKKLGKYVKGAKEILSD